MQPSFNRSRRLSVGFEDRALAGLLVILSVACSANVDTGGGTGGKGSGGTFGTGGRSGTGGSAGVTGGGGVTGSGGAAGRMATAIGGAAGGGASDGGSNDGGGSPTTAPSCAAGGPGTTDCGAEHDSCCTSLRVTGGTYFRTYRNNGAGPTGENDPATVSDYRLDKYLVTVGRYRQFASAWTSGWRPLPGAGKHAYLRNGGLANTAGGSETGWDASWNATTNVNPTTASLTRGSFCDGTHATWTASATGGHENLPINCVNWYEAYAFCIWDGGFLPSEAEWEYAAAGGAEQRQYPWGTAAPGSMSQYAIYGSFYIGNPTGLAPVGTAANGAGLWGQLDLAGEVWEWNLDWRQSYVNPCTDCVNLTPATFRLVRGDNFGGSVANLMPTVRGGDIAPEGRDSNFGVRCSRAP
jgi:sulfatase modifying factor 1